MHIEHGLLSGHVLQRTPRGAKATIEGVTGCSGPVTARVLAGKTALKGFANKRIGTAAKGRFRVVLAGLPVGGPYVVELACGTESCTVREIFVGDLWLMAGQSNMQGSGNMAGAPKPHAQVRCFTMARRWELARDPLHLMVESPDPVHSTMRITAEHAAVLKRNAIKGSGVGVWFGKLMQKSSAVPQGLISTAHGGTSMAQWSPALKDQGAASLYGSMLLSLQGVGQPIAGVLWYQGCSDANPDAAAVYTQRMQELVAAVRKDLRQPKLPWIIAQIGRVAERRADGGVTWNSVQEQQRLLPTTIKHCDVVPAIDLELDDHIHISGRAFALLATRLAEVAKRLVLGDRSVKAAIQPLSVRYDNDPVVANGVIEVRFANVVGGLRSEGLPQGFRLVDQDGQPTDAAFKTTLEGDCARVHVSVADPSRLRLMYGQGPNPICNVHDSRGMGVPVFGPLPITGLPASSDWFTTWRVSPIRDGEDIASLPRPAIDDPEAALRHFVCPQYPNFVNNHDEWMGRSGHVAFTCQVEAPEDMVVELRCGYDGPFRLWVGEREVLCDPDGCNPAVVDAKRLSLKLTKGRQPISILFALNQGQAWGFFMRMIRPGKSLTDGLALPKPC